MHQIKKKMKRINLESKLIDNSIISYEQARKSPASFHLLSGVNLDIPLVSIKLNVIETMNTDLLRHQPLSLLMTRENYYSMKTLLTP